MLTKRLFLLIFLLFAAPVESLRICGPHFFSLGPEAYYLKRNKKGGTWQDGWLFGVRGGYEKLNSKGLYLSVDGYWVTGELEGNSKAGNPLKSEVAEYEIEGRIGGSYSFPKSCCITWVPYLGYGYFTSHNDFVKPTPLIYNSKSTFYYLAGGGMVLLSIGDCWNAGFHFKYKLPEEPKCTIKNDPDYGTVVLNLGVKSQYEIELPIRYRCCWMGKKLGFMLAPFYRYRHYGHQANYPADSIDTKFHIWGGHFQIQMVL